MTEVLNEETGELTPYEDVTEEVIAAEMTPDAEETPDDEEETEETEPEDVEEAAPGLSQKQIEQRWERIGKAGLAYINRLQGILAEDFGDFRLSPLSLPGMPGFIFDPNVVPLDDEIVRNVRELFGDPSPVERLQATDAFTCPSCNGVGEVLSGSQVPKYRVVLCLDCEGKGFKGPREIKGGTPTAQLPSQAGQQPEEVPEEAPETDHWGRPKHHPGYMVMPYPNMPEHQRPPGYQG